MLIDFRRAWCGMVGYEVPVTLQVHLTDTVTLYVGVREEAMCGMW
jgi:hypothetical protein